MTFSVHPVTLNLLRFWPKRPISHGKFKHQGGKPSSTAAVAAPKPFDIDTSKLMICRKLINLHFLLMNFPNTLHGTQNVSSAVTCARDAKSTVHIFPQYIRPGSCTTDATVNLVL